MEAQPINALGAGADVGHGAAMHDLMATLFPICRSITGDGVRRSLQIVGDGLPMTVAEVPSGTSCFDWTVPDEWTVRDAYVMDQAGNRVIDFQAHNLHLVGYSEPFSGSLTLDELTPHLHSRPDLPDAIPYVTAYYAGTWGFCLTDRDRQALTPQTYQVEVDTDLAPGNLTYGEVLIPGDSPREVLLATNVCHPSMANNELSGPVVLAHLARYLMGRRNRLSYRIVFLPETIGAIAYLRRHSETMKERTIAGLQVVCVGGPDDFCYLETPSGDALVDRIVRRVLRHEGVGHSVLDHTHRASDERQWCSPGIGLPVGSLMKTRYHDYDAYHTSLDDLDFVRPEHLAASFDLYVRCLDALDGARTYRAILAGGEPNLGSRGLYPALGGRSHEDMDANLLLDVLAYSDGTRTADCLAERVCRPIEAVTVAIETLVAADLLAEV